MFAAKKKNRKHSFKKKSNVVLIDKGILLELRYSEKLIIVKTKFLRDKRLLILIQIEHYIISLTKICSEFIVIKSISEY